jgi:hypothetical protein
MSYRRRRRKIWVVWEEVDIGICRVRIAEGIGGHGRLSIVTARRFGLAYISIISDPT